MASRKLALSLATLSLLTAAPAIAGEVYLEASIRPQYLKSNEKSGLPLLDDSNVKPESGFGYDLRSNLGYIFSNHFLVGFGLNYSSLPLKRESTVGDFSGVPDDGVDRTLKRLEYGPSMGFFLGNFRVIGTYILAGSSTSHDKALGSSPELKVTDHVRSGYQVLMGWNFNLTRNLKVGPTVSYRYVTYKSQTQVTSSGANDYTKRPFKTKLINSNLEPMLTFTLQF